MEELLEAFEDVEYLGDGAYVGVQHGDLVLFTSDGLSITNEVVLGRAELHSLQDWLKAKKLV